MDKEEISKAIATGVMLEEQVRNTSNELAKVICTNINLLANLSPNMAISLLEDLQSQLTKEEADKLTDSKQKTLESLASKIKENL